MSIYIVTHKIFDIPKENGYIPIQVGAIRGHVLPKGAYLIAVRLLMKGEGELPEDFVFENIDNAYAYRKEIGVRKYGRMCYGEADNMPGLVIDRYPARPRRGWQGCSRSPPSHAWDRRQAGRSC